MQNTEKINSHDLRQDKRNRQLCEKIKQNDLNAETMLLLENEGLIVKIANNHEMVKAIDDAKYGGIELDDIIQEGRVAMLRAAQTFNTDNGGNTQFSTYAYTVIKNAMTDLCRRGLSAFEKIMLDKGLTRVFLDDDSTDEDGLAISEKISTDSEWHDQTGNLAVLHIMLQKMGNRFKDLLSDREQRLLSYKFGLSALQCKTISETAAYFHLTEKYANAIEATALKKLRKGMNDGKLI
ncbi:MAG: sigma-70 family RNA polymerase sigma factor [Lachnospiraceae bacterium]|nr:sigma-70 family RNA polymerase sigma factor [Lachnospiraceae bacterium]